MDFFIFTMDKVNELLNELHQQMLASSDELKQLLSSLKEQDKQNDNNSNVVDSQTNACDAASSRIDALENKVNDYEYTVEVEEKMLQEVKEQQSTIQKRAVALGDETKMLREGFTTAKTDLSMTSDQLNALDIDTLSGRVTRALDSYTNEIDPAQSTIAQQQTSVDVLQKERLDDDKRISAIPTNSVAEAAVEMSYRHRPGTQLSFVNYNCDKESSFSDTDSALSFAQKKIDQWVDYYPMYGVVYIFSNVHFSQDQGVKFLSNTNETYNRSVYTNKNTGKLVFVRIRYSISDQLGMSGDITSDDNGRAVYIYHDQLNFAVACIVLPSAKLYQQLAQAIDEKKMVYIVWQSTSIDEAKSMVKALHEAFGDRAPCDSLQPYDIERIPIGYVGCQRMLYREGFEQIKDSGLSCRLVVDHAYGLLAIKR